MVADSKIIIYQGSSGDIEFKGDFQNETIWATQRQMSELFGVDFRTISLHINNIYKTGELEKNSTLQEYWSVQKEGTRMVKRRFEGYNLDIIIAVGYRINSKTATKFRQWATKTLKNYLTRGFVINPKRVELNYQKFIDAIEETKKLIPESSEAFKSGEGLDLAKLFAKTWLSLDAYDKQSLTLKKPTKKSVKLTAEELKLAVEKFKSVLIKKGEATDLFATDRSKNSLEGIVGNVMQSIGGKFVYESIEEKSAHLLYFIIKNHPFVDGNKRTGAYSFIWFLEKVKMLDRNKITPETLTALTILVAESNPTHKENIVQLIMKLIEK